MMCALKDVERQERVRVRLVCVPDEESEELDERATDGIVKRGLGGNFAITGEPTNLHIGVEAMSVGRDGASDAASFLGAGIPAVEFGPGGAGHHGPEEWVSLTSMARYRRALGDF